MTRWRVVLVFSIHKIVKLIAIGEITMPLSCYPHAAQLLMPASTFQN